MGWILLRYCIIGLAIILCLLIGVFQLFPPLEGLVAVVLIVLIGIFFQNEKELNLLEKLLKTSRS